MTEQEWLESTDPQEMVSYCRIGLRTRKLRLFAVGCCRRCWKLLTDQRSRQALEVLEQVAEDSALSEELVGAYQQAEAAQDWTSWKGNASNAQHGAATAVLRAVSGEPLWAAKCAVNAMVAWQVPDRGKAYYPAQKNESRFQATFIRCLLGNPFRPIVLDSNLLTSTVVSLAHGAYTERELPSGHLHTDRLAVLADALEEAGCDNADVLDHLRGPGPHVRGCWSLDLIRGKD